MSFHNLLQWSQSRTIKESLQEMFQAKTIIERPYLQRDIIFFFEFPIRYQFSDQVCTQFFLLAGVHYCATNRDTGGRRRSKALLRDCTQRRDAFSDTEGFIAARYR